MTQPRGLGAKVLGGLFWTFSGTAAQALLQVAVMMVLARLLDPATFGAVAAALVVVKIASFVANLGIAGALIQRQDLDERHVKAAFAILVIFGILICGVIQLAAPGIAAFFRIDAVEGIVRLLALAIPLSSAAEVAAGLMRRNLRFRQLAGLNVVAFGIGYGLVGTGLALSGFGVWALAAAHVAQCAATLVLLLVMSPHPKAVLIRWSAFMELMRVGGGMVAWRMATNAALEADNLVVGRWLGAEALGLYSRAYWIAATPAILIGRGVGAVLFSTLARVQEDKAKLALAFRRGLTASNLIAVPASAATAVLAPELVAIVLGDQWMGTVVPLQILAFGLLFRLSVKVSDSLTAAAGAVYRTAMLQVIYAVAVFTGALAGKAYGIEGVAFGVLGALVLNFVLMARLALQITSLPVAELIGTFLPGILTALVIGLDLLLARTWLVSQDLPAVVVLLAALASAGVAFALLVRFAPRTFLGADGLWVLGLVLERLPGKIQRVACQFVAPSARPQVRTVPSGGLSSSP